MAQPVYCEKHARAALEAVEKRLQKYEWFVRAEGGRWKEEPQKGLCIIVTYCGTIPGQQRPSQFLGVPIEYAQQAPQIRLVART